MTNLKYTYLVNWLLISILVVPVVILINLHQMAKAENIIKLEAFTEALQKN